MVGSFEQFILNLSDITRYWHQIASEELARYGLKGAYAVYFTALHSAGGGMTAGEMCRVCGRDKSDVSRAIRAMEELGFVVRDGEAGSYRTPLRLTSQGRRAAEEISERARIAMECGGEGLSDEQRMELYRMLSVISDNLRAITRTGLPDKK